MIKIEILCPVCPKCNQVEQLIKRVIKILGAGTRVVEDVAISHVTDYRQFSKYSVNVAKTPILVINGNVEFAGCIPETELLKKKLSEVIKGR